MIEVALAFLLGFVVGIIGSIYVFYRLLQQYGLLDAFGKRGKR